MSVSRQAVLFFGRLERLGACLSRAETSGHGTWEHVIALSMLALNLSGACSFALEGGIIAVPGSW